MGSIGIHTRLDEIDKLSERRPEIALFLPDLMGGGAERVMVHLANGFVQRGRKVDFVLMEAKGPYLTDLHDDVRVVDLQSRHSLKSVLPLARYLRRAMPAVLVSALDHANVAALCAKRLARVATRMIPTVHIPTSQALSHATTLRDRLLPAAMRRCYRWADAIVAPAQGTADDLIQMTGVPADLVRVIYNPVITPRIVESAEACVDHPWLLAGERPVVIGMGRLTPQKDFETLLRAFALLRKDVDCRLLILGEGAERSRLEALVERLRLSEAVAMPGFVKNPFAYLARASLFVLSSAWEALPTVLIEALALKVPVVATDCVSGPREILKEGAYGRLVPVGDEESLARAMRETLDGPREEVPKEALEPYTLDVAVERYVELISEVSHA